MLITVHGSPAGQGNHRVSKTGAIYETTKNHKPWREAILYAVLELAPHSRRADPILFRGPVSLQICFYLHRPKSAKKGARPDKKPDLDKLQRSTFDALTSAGVFEDDSRVVSVHATKRYAGDESGLTVPGALIFVEKAA